MRIIAGPNGSGKTALSTTLRKMNLLGPFINADELTRAIQDTHVIEAKDWGLCFDKDQVLSHFKACGQLDKYEGRDDLLKEMEITEEEIRIPLQHANAYVGGCCGELLRKELVEEGISFAFETVFSHPSKLEEIKEAKKKNFRIYIYFVSTENVEINIGRVKQRVKTKDTGTHDVPVGKIRGRYTRCMELLRDMLRLADRAYVFDNSKQGAMEWVVEIEAGNIKYKGITVPRWFEKYVFDKHPSER